MTDGNNSPQGKTGTAGAIKSFLNPIVAIAFAMVLAIILLIGATTLGLDKGWVLTRMSQAEFARGLTTYLVAVVTIGTPVGLVVSAFTWPETPPNERRSRRG